MDLTNAKLGDIYKVFINDKKEIVDEPTLITMVGTIIAKKKSGAGFIIGWKKDQEHPANCNARGKTSIENDYVADQSLYAYGRSVPITQIVASKVSTNMDGIACRRCLHFYFYAVPNQADGSLLCWSCRNTW